MAKAWSQQFVTPTIERLVGELPSEARPGFKAIRKWLDQSITEKPKLVFYSAAWGWAEQRVLEEPHAGALQEVYMVPDPDRPRVSISFQRRYFEQHPINELHKGVQAEVQEGVCVGRVVWVECLAESESHAEGICSFLEALHTAK